MSRAVVKFYVIDFWTLTEVFDRGTRRIRRSTQSSYNSSQTVSWLDAALSQASAAPSEQFQAIACVRVLYVAAPTGRLVFLSTVLSNRWRCFKPLPGQICWQ